MDQPQQNTTPQSGAPAGGSLQLLSLMGTPPTTASSAAPITSAAPAASLQSVAPAISLQSTALPAAPAASQPQTAKPSVPPAAQLKASGSPLKPKKMSWKVWIGALGGVLAVVVVIVVVVMRGKPGLYKGAIPAGNFFADINQFTAACEYKGGGQMGPPGGAPDPNICYYPITSQNPPFYDARIGGDDVKLVEAIMKDHCDGTQPTVAMNYIHNAQYQLDPAGNPQCLYNGKIQPFSFSPTNQLDDLYKEVKVVEDFKTYCASTNVNGKWSDNIFSNICRFNGMSYRAGDINTILAPAVKELNALVDLCGPKGVKAVINPPQDIGEKTTCTFDATDYEKSADLQAAIDKNTARLKALCADPSFATTNKYIYDATVPECSVTAENNGGVALAYKIENLTKFLAKLDELAVQLKTLCKSDFAAANTAAWDDANYKCSFTAPLNNIAVYYDWKALQTALAKQCTTDPTMNWDEKAMACTAKPDIKATLQPSDIIANPDKPGTTTVVITSTLPVGTQIGAQIDKNTDLKGGKLTFAKDLCTPVALPVQAPPQNGSSSPVGPQAPAPASSPSPAPLSLTCSIAATYTPSKATEAGSYQFNIIASTKDGSVSKSVPWTVTVQSEQKAAAEQAPTCIMNVQPTEVDAGKTSELSMKVFGKITAITFDDQKISNDQQIAKIISEGTKKSVTPSSSMNYSGAVEGPGGLNACSAQLIVKTSPQVNNDETNKKLEELTKKLADLSQKNVNEQQAPPPEKCANPKDTFNAAKGVCVPPVEVVKSTDQNKNKNETKKIMVLEAPANTQTAEQIAEAKAAADAARQARADAAAAAKAAADEVRKAKAEAAAEARAAAVADRKAKAEAAAEARKLHGSFIEGQTGPEALLYPMVIALGNGAYFLIRKRKKVQ